MQNPAPGRERPQAGDWLLGRKFDEDLVVLVEKKLNKSLQGALAVAKAQHVLDCHSKR